jgi:CHAT domain-containing protein
LHYLPFAALSDGQRDLIDDYTLTSLPNASALPFIQENANSTADHRPQTALILGNPVTGDYDATAALATERGGLGALPFAEQEAKAIAALYGVQPLIGAAATESALRTEAAQAGFIHLAAHGVYNPAAPLSSLIALAPDEPATGSGQNPSTGSGQAANDGWLTVGEVYGLDLSHTDLVVLSACQTNLGELSAGDEVVGLTRAFIFAGAPSVIASLWNVEDQATALLMERFYTHLRDGMGKAQALRQAQLEIRAEYPNPYYWAGFVLSGDGGPTQADQGAEEPVGQVPQAAQATPAPGPGVQVQEGQPVEEIRPWSMASVVGALLVVILLVGGAVLWRRMRRRHSTRELQENERQWEERG